MGGVWLWAVYGCGRCMVVRGVRLWAVYGCGRCRVVGGAELCALRDPNTRLLRWSPLAAPPAQRLSRQHEPTPTRSNGAVVLQAGRCVVRCVTSWQVCGEVCYKLAGVW